MDDARTRADLLEARPVIDVGALFRGLVLLRRSARIDGRVEGRVEAAADLLIGAAGCVIGPVDARDAQVAGRVEGDLRASDRIVLEPTAHVRGELSAPRLVLREGSFLEGSCQSGAALASEAGSSREAAPLEAGPPRNSARESG